MMNDPLLEKTIQFVLMFDKLFQSNLAWNVISQPSSDVRPSPQYMLAEEVGHYLRKVHRVFTWVGQSFDV